MDFHDFSEKEPVDSYNPPKGYSYVHQNFPYIYGEFWQMFVEILRRVARATYPFPLHMLRRMISAWAPYKKLSVSASE